MEIKTRNIDVLIKECEEQLRVSGYSPVRIKANLSMWQKGIKRFMDEKGITEYNSDIGEEYLLHTVMQNDSRSANRGKFRNIRILTDCLESGTVRKRIVPLVNNTLSGEIGNIAESFLQSLRELRYKELTIKEHHRILYYFITRMEMNSKNRVDKITEREILEFTGSSTHNKKKYFYTIRLFCRFLYRQKYITENLEYVLGKNNFPKREKIPSVYSAEEIKRVEETVDQASAVGKRDYAIILLASRLGLRASDICGLQFSNIDWDRNTIHIIQYKTQRVVELPLLKDVGEAIINYLRYGRPYSNLPQLFLTAKAPYQVLRREALSCAIARIMKDSGIDVNQRQLGPHVMRHSLASRLLKNGIPLPVISETLGHQRTQTTMEYIRVDLDSLEKCILHVPIVNQAFYEQKGGIFYE